MHNKPEICLINLNCLKSHEKISLPRGARVLQLLTTAGKFTKPIIVDKKSNVILDGHHRAYVLKKLGYREIPALAVNYQSRSISVKSRRKEYKVNKKIVIERALKQNLFPYKTTKHFLKNTLPAINISFQQLKHHK